MAGKASEKTTLLRDAAHHSLGSSFSLVKTNQKKKQLYFSSFCVLGPMLHAWYTCSYFIITTTIYLISATKQMSTLRLREPKKFVQGHTARKGSQGSYPDQVATAIFIGETEAQRKEMTCPRPRNNTNKQSHPSHCVPRAVPSAFHTLHPQNWLYPHASFQVETLWYRKVQYPAKFVVSKQQSQELNPGIVTGYDGLAILHHLLVSSPEQDGIKGREVSLPSRLLPVWSRTENKSTLRVSSAAHGDFPP